MKWPYRAGTRVKINAKGFSAYGRDEANPKCEGAVNRIWKDEGGDLCWVKWDNGQCNSYEQGTLDVVHLDLENK